MSTLTSQTVTSLQLDHLGIIGGILKDVNMRFLVNKALSSSKFSATRKVTHGDSVCAMVLNGLGFSNRAMYLVADFFKNKPVESLIHPSISASDLNDDALGKTLDAIAEIGPSEFYAQIAYEVAKNFDMLGDTRLMDATSFSLKGAYNGFGDDPENAPQILSVTYGYSKQKRPDLKQVMLNSVHDGSSAFPLFIEALSGNTSDKKSFHETMRRVNEFEKQFCIPDILCWIADAALYSKEGLLKEVVDYNWITRVPENYKEAKQLVENPDNAFAWVPFDNGYKTVSVCPLMEGVKQRWVLVFSEHAYKLESRTFERNLEKEKIKAEKQLWHLEKQEFACIPDAEKAFKSVLKKFSHFNASFEIIEKAKHSKAGKPKKGAKPEVLSYFIKGKLVRDEVSITKSLSTKGRFILATNQMDEELLSDQDILVKYKGLSSVEKGFRFLKDPWFMIDKFFIKTPNRIAALMAVMSLMLMIYNLGEYRLRKALKEQKTTLPNQLKKEISNPTLRWIFQMMMGISIVTIKSKNSEQRIVANITSVQKKIIRMFGANTMEVYGFNE